VPCSPGGGGANEVAWSKRGTEFVAVGNHQVAGSWTATIQRVTLNPAGVFTQGSIITLPDHYIIYGVDYAGGDAVLSTCEQPNLPLGSHPFLFRPVAALGTMNQAPGTCRSDRRLANVIAEKP
jgi:hypothetical protein